MKRRLWGSEVRGRFFTLHPSVLFEFDTTFFKKPRLVLLRLRQNQHWAARGSGRQPVLWASVQIGPGSLRLRLSLSRQHWPGPSPSDQLGNGVGGGKLDQFSKAPVANINMYQIWAQGLL